MSPSTMKLPPKQQRLDEWQSLDDAGLQYHLQQWRETKRSTVRFTEFIAQALGDSKKVLDIGCGAGSATAYIAAANRQINFVGLDLSAEVIKIANELSAVLQLSNLSFATDDWFDLGYHADVDGVVSLQTLSWLPEFEEPLRQLFRKVGPEWIALSSLFYEGDVSCRIEVEEHVTSKKCFYNVYSLPAVDRLAWQFGYRVVNSMPFDIDIDIPVPVDKNAMGTYTVQVAQGEVPPCRLQISGPLLMNWYFVMLRRQVA